MKTPTTGLIAVLGASALLAAGCGSSSKTSSSTSAASAYPTANETTSTAATTTPSSTASAPSAAAATTVSVKHASKLGTILAAGPKKMTVYLFEADKGSSSSCSGACASAWPPVTTSGKALAGAGSNGADLGTLTRPDGTTQVTYKGHPLYYFVKDKDSGDSYGQGSKAFGASWYVLAPSGSKVDKS
jgi:predicted lipoprotein with Yx(FWY)xxD motif